MPNERRPLPPSTTTSAGYRRSGRARAPEPPPASIDYWPMPGPCSRWSGRHPAAASPHRSRRRPDPHRRRRHRPTRRQVTTFGRPGNMPMRCTRPNSAYRDAVRAVEALALPAGAPEQPQAHPRHRHRPPPRRWPEVVICARRQGRQRRPGPLAAIMERLWTGQVSRHGGGQNSREQTPEEAQAAVHLAAAIVQLLATGALGRRSTS